MSNRYLWLVLGIFFGCLAVQALFTGESVGFGSSNTAGRDISYTENPIEFTLMTVFEICASIGFLKSFLSSK
ncbi:hypothetical protein NBRC116591_38900 [Sessilibacter corallicola]|uniref:Uncharacterized protein n=1 Tax=Sessilibacter corallicola TaxID=2904075 RepID=A0ABQ0AEK2_9GAMM